MNGSPIIINSVGLPGLETSGAERSRVGSLVEGGTESGEWVEGSWEDEEMIMLSMLWEVRTSDVAIMKER